ncbi:phage portal protein [Ottowia sp. SB7-C50]|uniref:phage portal protein n=1 Tax=Ottowia sp. SB7-C50 TaxID=3081231 RepID=UPI002952A898|nr:phage portal protein [Ottowia sp. SB7-C50]WOP14516.1 phage portal protein [Ottowia sp. SB7-C50]WOP15931.1 phage portal protein [Ottowia sp. SB7-C50]
MGLIERTARALGFERRATNPNDTWAAFQALRTASITPESAQSVAAVYGAVAVISEAIGTLPLRLYKRGDDSRTPADDHALHKCLHREPNEHQSSQEFIEWMTAAMLLHGNSYARVIRGNDGQVRALIPLAPERVNVLRKGDAIGGFDYTDRDGKRERLLPDEVFHLRHRAGPDPLIGQSPIQAARSVIELALAESQHGVANFTNGTKLSGIIKMPGKLKAEQRESLKQSWQTQYAGASNAGRTPVLEEGADFVPLSMSLEDAEYIAARQFSVQEVARIFKVPPPLLADLGEANYSNAVQVNRWFVTHCLGRHMAAWEGAISRQLLTDAGKRLYYPEFSAEGLLRGDSEVRAAFYASGIGAGWLLPAEARKLENLPAIKATHYRPNPPPKGAA